MKNNLIGRRWESRFNTFEVTSQFAGGKFVVKRTHKKSGESERVIKNQYDIIKILESKDA